MIAPDRLEKIQSAEKQNKTLPTTIEFSIMVIIIFYFRHFRRSVNEYSLLSRCYNIKNAHFRRTQSLHWARVWMVDAIIGRFALKSGPSKFSLTGILSNFVKIFYFRNLSISRVFNFFKLLVIQSKF